MSRRERNSNSKIRVWIDGNISSATEHECMNFPFPVGSHGYGMFSVRYRKMLAHRYVCEKAHGVPPTAEHQAAHSCGNKTCVNPHHLRWATRVENEDDKRSHGTNAAGERNGATKLTIDDVAEIRRSKKSHRSIASVFGVSSSTVGRIKRGETWGHSSNV